METRTHQTNIMEMTRIALCTALLCASSYLVIPLPFTPIVLSMHTVMVNLIGLVLKPKQAAYTILLYLLMGLIGLPVFSGGTAGLGKLLGPTGGFYFGFLFAATAISALKGNRNSLGRYILVTVAVGIPIQHLCAIVMMGMHNGWELRAAALTVSLPFLPGDVVKCVLASTMGAAIRRVTPDF